jgi:hypothetical protein
MRTRLHPLLSTLLSTAVLGCTGALDAGPSPTSSTPPIPLRVPLRQLTPTELDYALADLVHDDTHLAMRLQPTRVRSGVETLASPDFAYVDARSDLLVETMYDVAFHATEHDAQLAGCVASSGDACIQEALTSLAARAFRRPLTSEERTRFMRVVTELEPTLGRREAIARALQALLLTPDFLYLTAEGERPTDVDVSPSELASRLAFFLWASLPDEALLAAAARGDLNDETLRAAQVRRMLDDPRSGRSMARFVLGWTQALEINTRPKADPIWTGELARDAVQETDTFVQDWFRTDGNGFAELFASDHTFLTPRLAALYGLTVPSGTGENTMVRVDGTARTGRVGLLTQASFLAVHAHDTATSPTLRGHWFIESALCQSIGNPPMDALSRAPLMTSDMTTREWHEALEAAPGCADCHRRMEPPGYALEGFDAIGRVRTLDRGEMVQTQTTLRTNSDLDGDFRGPVDLSEAMGESLVVRGCFSQRWLSYALGRPVNASDRVLVRGVTDALESDVQEAAFRIATSVEFRRAKAPMFSR